MATATYSIDAPTAAHSLSHQYIAFALMAGFFAVAPFIGLYPVFMMKVLCFALFACAFNLLIGYVGLLSFGHAMFLGTAGYVSAHAAKVWGFPPELAILVMYFVVLAIFLFGFLLIYRTIHSPFGQVLKAIRENEPRAISLGYKTEQYKLIAFVLSASLAGLAGGTKAIVFQLASLTDVNWPMSGEVVLMTLLGGLGTVFGPVAGAFMLISLEHYLAQVGSWVTVVQGVIFVICVLAFRRGVIGELGRVLKKPL
jgi:branched-chain amino acid transport system permease protein